MEELRIIGIIALIAIVYVVGGLFGWGLKGLGVFLGLFYKG